MERGHPCPHERAARKNVMTVTTDYEPIGWHSRGYLPHFDAGEVFQSITFRLYDSMPQRLLEEWKHELASESEEREDELRYRIEAYLDRGIGACYLADERIAALVQSALTYFDSQRYRLSAWVVMPNHVHLLAAPCIDHSLSNIMHSLKSYTAQEANRLLNRRGNFWFPSLSRLCSSRSESNPVRAGLCKTARDWRFGSAWFRGKQMRSAAV